MLLCRCEYAPEFYKFLSVGVGASQIRLQNYADIVQLKFVS